MKFGKNQKVQNMSDMFRNKVQLKSEIYFIQQIISAWCRGTYFMYDGKYEDPSSEVLLGKQYYLQCSTKRRNMQTLL